MFVHYHCKWPFCVYTLYWKDVIKKLEKYRDTDVPNIQKDAETYDKYR